MTKTLDGVIHGRTIELADDPGLTDGEHVVVQVRSKAARDNSPSRTQERGVSADVVRGLCNPGGGIAPDDEECRRILEEELLRKHSP